MPNCVNVDTWQPVIAAIAIGIGLLIPQIVALIQLFVLKEKQNHAIEQNKQIISEQGAVKEHLNGSQEKMLSSQKQIIDNQAKDAGSSS
jgi:hypothetical protein